MSIASSRTLSLTLSRNVDPRRQRPGPHTHLPPPNPPLDHPTGDATGGQLSDSEVTAAKDNCVKAVALANRVLGSSAVATQRKPVFIPVWNEQARARWCGRTETECEYRVCELTI
eukprot:6911083-Prymnesium_polylepis.1